MAKLVRVFVILSMVIGLATAAALPEAQARARHAQRKHAGAHPPARAPQRRVARTRQGQGKKHASAGAPHRDKQKHRHPASVKKKAGKHGGKKHRKPSSAESKKGKHGKKTAKKQSRGKRKKSQRYD